MPYRVVIIPIFGHDKLDIIVPYLVQQKDAFDELRMWINTLNVDSVNRCRAAARTWPWMSVVFPSSPVVGATVLASFYDTCSASDATYLQIHEDVVWLDEGFVETLCATCEASSYAVLHASAINHPSFALESDDVLRVHHDFLASRRPPPVQPSIVPTEATVFPCACVWMGSADRAGARAVAGLAWCSFLCTTRQRLTVERSDVPNGYASIAPAVATSAAYSRGRPAV